MSSWNGRAGKKIKNLRILSQKWEIIVYLDRSLDVLNVWCMPYDLKIGQAGKEADNEKTEIVVILTTV